jgi:hypothetical protein
LLADAVSLDTSDDIDGPATSERQVLVLDGHTFDSRIPPRVARGAAALVARAGLRLGGVRFRVTGTRWQFVGASGTPDLLDADRSTFLDALVSASLAK